MLYTEEFFLSCLCKVYIPRCPENCPKEKKIGLGGSAIFLGVNCLEPYSTKPFSKNIGRKTSWCRIVKLNQSKIFPSLKTEKKVIFFFKKCFLFFKFIYNNIYNNISTVKYSISYLSFLGKKTLPKI